MFKRHTWFRALLALVAIVLLLGAGMAIFRAGQWQGYRMDPEASKESFHEVFPHGGARRTFDRRMPVRHFGFGFPWLIGRFLFRIGGLLVLVLVIGGVFRRMAWRAACAHGGKGWMGHHHPHYPGHPHGPPHRSFHGKVRPDEAEDQMEDRAEQE